MKRKEVEQNHSRIPIPQSENVKRIKMSPEPTLVKKPVNRKHKSSPTKKSVLGESSNIPPSSEIKPPTSNRFMVTPNLPGIRTTIPQEKISVKDMLKKFGHKYQQQVMSSEDLTDDSSQYESNHQEDLSLIEKSQREDSTMPESSPEETEGVKSISNWYPLAILTMILSVAGAIVYFYNQFPSDNNNIVKIYGSLVAVEINHLYGETLSIASELGKEASTFFDNLAQKAHGFVREPTFLQKMIVYLQAKWHQGLVFFKNLNLPASLHNAKDLIVLNMSKMNVYVNDLLEKGLAESAAEIANVVEEVCFNVLLKATQGFNIVYRNLWKMATSLYYKTTNDKVRASITRMIFSMEQAKSKVQMKVASTYAKVVDKMSEMMPDKFQLSISGLLLVTGLGFISLAYLLST